MTEPAEDVLLTPEEVSDILRVHANTLYKWRIENKNLPFIRLGDGPRPAVRYRKSQVLKYLAEHHVKVGGNETVEHLDEWPDEDEETSTP